MSDTQIFFHIYVLHPWGGFCQSHISGRRPLESNLLCLLRRNLSLSIVSDLPRQSFVHVSLLYIYIYICIFANKGAFWSRELHALACIENLRYIRILSVDARGVIRKDVGERYMGLLSILVVSSLFVGRFTVWIDGRERHSVLPRGLVEDRDFLQCNRGSCPSIFVFGYRNGRSCFRRTLDSTVWSKFSKHVSIGSLQCSCLGRITCP